MPVPPNFPYKHSGNIESFDEFGSVNIVNGTSDVAKTFRVPYNAKSGFITEFGHGIDNPTAFETSVWRIQVNGASVRHYDSIQDELAPFNDPKPVSPIRVSPGDVVSVLVENNGAATRKYAARVRGFYDYGKV